MLFPTGFIYAARIQGSVPPSFVTDWNGLTGSVSVTTSALPEGTNLYFTDSRAQSAVVVGAVTNGDTTHSPSGAAVFTELAGKANSFHTHVVADITDFTIEFGVAFDTKFSTKNTDDLAEGGFNKYYSTTLFNNDFASKTSDDVPEGVVNLYYTDARAQAAFTPGTDIDITLGVISSTYSYTLPTASAGTLGGIKVGSGLSIDGFGVLSAIGAVASVFGRTGTVTAQSGDYDTDLVTEGVVNLYYTNARARLALSATGPLNYNNIGGVFSIDQATSSVDGYLSSTDWSTFNSKQDTLTLGNISTSTTGVSITGGTGSIIGSGVSVNIQTATTSQPGLLSSVDWNTFNNKQSALTFGAIYSSNTAIIITNGNNSTVGPNVQINIPDADGATTGLLTSADWNIFNNKQDALGYTAENVANKSTNTSLGTSNTLYPSQNAVKVYVDSAISGISYPVTSVFGRTGAVVSQSGDYTTTQVTEGTNLYFTDPRADARITAQKGMASGLATLDGSGKIPTSQLPALAITDTFVVASQVAMLSLTAETGDVAVRTDQSKSYILAGTDPTVLGDWQELLSPGGGVISVNGFTGAVTLTTTDIAEGTNLYYTSARFNTAFSAKSTTDLAEGTNLYYTSARFNTAFSAKTTDDLSEGATNLYYTNARADARITLQKGAASGLASLDANSKLTASQVPANGSVSVIWEESDTPPVASFENNVRIYSFTPGITQKLHALVKVPANYSGGQVKLKLSSYSGDSSGTNKVITVATLIRKGTDAMSSTTNQTTTTTTITLSGVTINIPQDVSSNLSDTSGQINSVAISAGDYILVELKRDSADTATGDMKLPVRAMEITFA